jgi:hypothetical protein
MGLRSFYIMTLPTGTARKDRGMHSRWARFGAATALTVAITAGSAVATANDAAAATPILLGSCATSVQGAPGTPVELSPAAVVTPITSLIDAIPLLGPPLAKPFQTAFTALPPIPLGALPTGKGTITGGQIANDVIAQLRQLPLLGPILGTLIGGVQSTLAGLCSVTVTGVDAVVAPVQDGTTSIDKGSQQAQQDLGIIPKGSSNPGSGGGTPSKGGTPVGTGPVQQGGGGASGNGTTKPPGSNSPVVGGVPAGLGTGGSLFGAGTLLDYGLAESPLSRYAGIPFASAGLFDPAPGVKYGGDVSGYSPSYGVLGQDGTVPPDGVQTAGHAEALGPSGALGNGVGLPMLLAVLMLAGVTAALVRTWVLRKVRVP